MLSMLSKKIDLFCFFCFVFFSHKVGFNILSKLQIHIKPNFSEKRNIKKNTIDIFFRLIDSVGFEDM